MFPMRSEYKELGLELVSLEFKSSRTPKRPLMAGEKKYDRKGDPFKLLIVVLVFIYFMQLFISLLNDMSLIMNHFI